MATWGEFEAAAPDMARAGRELFTQHGIGLAYLATVRPDGGPRLHPICVILTDGGLYGFLVPSPKREDLLRDGRHAVHAFPPDEVDDEFVVTGRSQPVDDPDRVTRVAAAYRKPDGTQMPVQEDDRLFEFGIETALLARYRYRGDWPPAYTRWRAGEPKPMRVASSEGSVEPGSAVTS
jgi:hypothetical protein